MAAILAGAPPQPGGVVGQPVSAPSSVLTAAEVTASSLAASSGVPTPVSDSITSTSQVLANPNGSFTLQTSVKPVRVPAALATESGLDPDGDGWVPVDTTLHVADDGRLEPKAAASALSLSPGGDTSIVTVSSDGSAASDGTTTTGTASGTTSDDSVTLKWPTALPTPTIDGSTATYPDVMPGVDLAVTANVDSYSEVLVVKTAQAAANPQLTHVGFGVDLSPDLQVSEAGAQTLTAVDTQTGQQVFSSATPVVWDSTTDPNLGPKPTVTDPGGSAPAPLDVAVTQNTTPTTDGADATVSVAVPQSELTGSAVTYPVYIDPSIGTRTDQASINVQSDGSSYYQPSDFLRSGLCGWSGCNSYNHIDRSFSAFDVHELTGRATTAVVSSGRVYAREVWNAGGCTAYNVGLWSGHGFGPSTVWSDNTAVSLLQTINTAAGGGSSCPAADLQFGDGGVTARFQEAATKDVPQLIFGFLSYDEGNRNAWKKYDVNPRIEVDYSFPPTAPTSLAASGTYVCNGTIHQVTGSQTLSAVPHDTNDPAGNMNTVFRLYNANTNAVIATSPAVSKPSGQTATWPQPTLGSGSYYFTATTSNAAGQSSGSVSGTWVIDTTSPPAPAKSDMVSMSYPLTEPSSTLYGDPAGLVPPGTIHVSAPGADGFAYAWDNGSTTAITAIPNGKCATTDASKGLIEAPNGAADIQIPYLAKGPHTIHVASYDDAHNKSVDTTMSFVVSPPDSRTLIQGETPGTFTATSATGSAVPSYKESTSATSGGAQQHFVTSQINDQISYQVNAPQDGSYEVMIEAYTSNHAGIIQASIDGCQATYAGADGYPTADLYSGASARLQQKLLASCNTWQDPRLPTPTIGLTKGPHTITLTVVGKNPNSVNYADANGGNGGNDNGYSVAVDYIRLTNTDTSPATTDHLNAGDTLTGGTSLWSPNGLYQFTMQNDGNAVVYQSGVGAIFNTGTNGHSGSRLTLQTDGNLVVYSNTNQALWANGARTSTPPAILTMQDDGNLVEYSPSGTAIWSSKGGLVK